MAKIQVYGELESIAGDLKVTDVANVRNALSTQGGTVDGNLQITGSVDASGGFSVNGTPIGGGGGTDEKVKQTNTAENHNYRVLLDGIYTDNEYTGCVYKSASLTFNPNSKSLLVNSGDGKVNNFKLNEACEKSVIDVVEDDNGQDAYSLTTADAVTNYVLSKTGVDSVTENKIANGAVTNDKIANNTISEEKLDENVRTKLNGIEPGEGWVPTEGCIITEYIAESAVTANKIANSAVTEGKLSQDVQEKLNNGITSTQAQTIASNAAANYSNINNGVITIGDNTITPLTSGSSIAASKITWGTTMVPYGNIPGGTSSTTFAYGNHDHALSLAKNTSSTASSITLEANTKYTLTAGGKTYIFTTPPSGGSITINGSSTGGYYAPTAGGTAGCLLVANGNTIAPSWKTVQNAIGDFVGINNGTINVGSTTITPLTSSSTLNASKISWGSSVVPLGNLPTGSTESTLALGAHSHKAEDITSGTLDALRLPIATANALGGIKVGSGLSISTTGVLSATSTGTTYKTTFNGQNYGDKNTGENLGSFYAPTTYGAANSVLLGAGANTAPTWSTSSIGAAAYKEVSTDLQSGGGKLPTEGAVVNGIQNWANISSGTITIGGNSITPLTTSSTLPSSFVIDGGSASSN